MKKLVDSLYKYRKYIGVDGMMYLAFAIVLLILFLFFS